MSLYRVSWIEKSPGEALVEASSKEEAIEKAKAGELIDPELSHGTMDKRSVKCEGEEEA